MLPAPDVRRKLDGYPEDILQAYESFLDSRDPDQLTRFVIGMLLFLQDAADPANIPDLSDQTNLREDLGVDSITIAEVVFLLEDIFEIEIENAALMDISTVGELKAYVLSRLS